MVGYHILGSSQLGDLRAVGWVTHYITNTVTVEAGYRYVLDGEQMIETCLTLPLDQQDDAGF